MGLLTEQLGQDGPQGSGRARRNETEEHPRRLRSEERERTDRWVRLVGGGTRLTRAGERAGGGRGTGPRKRGKEDWAGLVGEAQGKWGSAQGKKRASGPSGRGGPVLLGWKLGSWAGFGFPSSFSNKLKPHSNLIEFKPNLNSNPMHSIN